MIEFFLILICLPIIYVLSMCLLDVFLKNLGAWKIGIPLVFSIIIFAAIFP